MISERRAHSYCRDDISKIENYDKAIADTTQTWDIHHRLELTLDGEFAHTSEELQRLGMYYQRPYFELIFLTHAEHRRIHSKCIPAETRKKIADAIRGVNHPFYGKPSPRKGKHQTEEARQKISNANKGENNAMYGKHHSEETKRKMREAALRREAKKRADICQ